MRVERMPVKLTEFSRDLASHQPASYYGHYESGNFAIRAGAYFSVFVKTDLILKHLYAHNLGKKVPHKSRVRHQTSLVPVLFISRREQNRSVPASRERKLQSRVLQDEECARR